MKFAHDFKDSLAREEFPPHWVKHAIPYAQLKKCLKKVERELLGLGLDTDTLRTLLDPNTTSPVALKYQLNSAASSDHIRPRLTVYVHLQDGVAIDASLTPISRRFFERIAAELQQSQTAPRADPATSPATEDVAQHGNASDAHEYSSNTPKTDNDVASANGSQHSTLETIEVPLVFDSEFFELLQKDVQELELLQAEERQKMTREITELGKEVSRAARPSRFSKNDMSTWRKIFELYLDAEVFFATHEQDHGNRSSKTALKQLQWFQNEIENRNLPQKFTMRESNQAFSKFLNLNVTLLKNIQFQELNRLAVYKIIKKFDKRTSLGVSSTFPTAIRSDKVLGSSLAQDMCAQMSKELVSIVPQISEHLCPVCFSLAYLPVRLDCKHVFCIRCVIKIQRRKDNQCPLCRCPVVLNATEDHVDRHLERYLRKTFPQEAKEKQRANELERGIEDFGADYKPETCSIM